MTEKRFEYVKPVVAFAKSGIIDNLKQNTFDFTEDNVIDILNELNEENKTFREALKELKEIGDYQAMRIRELSNMNSLIEYEIDKKIAILTDAKIKSFQNEDEELLGKIKFSIQVLRELKEVISE